MMNQRHFMGRTLCAFLLGAIPCATLILETCAGQLQGEIVDRETGILLPARLYIQSREAKFYLARSASPQGTAVTYNKDRGVSLEVHTTLSADRFVADLPPGEYKVTAERGKEYLAATQSVSIGERENQGIRLGLRRWIRMADLGWYSGDTHVHRTVAELPNVVLAEDLNVTLPLTYWVTDTNERPNTDNKNPAAPPAAELIAVDDTHVIWPVNTEYEIFGSSCTRVGELGPFLGQGAS
ncbi:MAG: hypothetical protein O2960_21930 [Verrucomicrobia bacterium]|nr:hypothetical protein [Verrucomicrobiota bacterium]